MTNAPSAPERARGHPSSHTVAPATGRPDPASVTCPSRRTPSFISKERLGDHEGAGVAYSGAASEWKTTTLDAHSSGSGSS